MPSVRSSALFVFDPASMSLRCRSPCCGTLLIVPTDGNRWADEKITGECRHYQGRYSTGRVAESVGYFSAPAQEAY